MCIAIGCHHESLSLALQLVAYYFSCFSKFWDDNLENFLSNYGQFNWIHKKAIKKPVMLPSLVFLLL